jgi:hypothetical protein
MNVFSAPIVHVPYEIYTPPPPQALQPAFVPTSVSEPSGASAYLNRYEDLLARIEVEQEELRDARDSLVGSRFRLRTRRRELRATREQAVGQVGETFELMRRYFLVSGLGVPDEIESAWAGVDVIRDKLGGLEIDFEEAEEKYNVQEWQYTEKEKDFIEALSKDTVASPEGHLAAGLMRDLTRFSGDPLNTEASFDTDAQLVLPSPSNTIAESDSESSDLGETMGSEEFTHELSAKLTVSRSQNNTSTEQLMRSRKHQSNINMSHESVEWSVTLKNIDEWMFGALAVSSFHQRWLRSLLPRSELSDEELWQLILRHWHSDTPDNSAFHTGDTTVSGTAISQAVTSSEEHETSSTSAISSPGTRPSYIHPPFPEDRMADELSCFQNPPKNIKYRDLADTPRHVAFQIASSSSASVSTQPTVMPQEPPLSGFDGDESAAPVSTQPSITTRTSSPLQQARSRSVEPTTTQTTDMTITSKPSTLSHSSLGTVTTQCPNRGSEVLLTSDEQYNLGDTDSTWVMICRQSNTIRSSSSVAVQPPTDALHNVRNADDTASLGPQPSSGVMDCTQDLAEAHIIDAINPSDEAGHHHSLPRSHTRYPYAPFIRVKSPQPWNLPLLRLTPLPTPSSVETPGRKHSNRLENIPFVTISDSPFQLPGPSTSSSMYYFTVLS